MSTSVVTTSDHRQQLPTAPGPLRKLDGLEEYFWLIEQQTSVAHSIIAQVNGSTNPSQWVDAIKAIEAKYPRLSLTIRKVAGERPFFEKVQGNSLSWRIVPYTDFTVLEEEMQADLQTSFGDGTGPLSRVTIYYSPGRSAIMFSTHHSCMDGKSHILLVQDLLAAVNSEDIGEVVPIYPSLTELLGLPPAPEYIKTLPKEEWNIEDAPPDRPARVRRVQLEISETERLRTRAKEEGTTVHAALITALTIAGQRVHKAWRESPVYCMSPIEMRGMLNLPDAAGVIVAGYRAAVPLADGQSFWDTARRIRKEMLPAISLEGGRLSASVFASLVDEEQTPKAFVDRLVNNPATYHLMVTNYAGYQVRTDYGELHIENLFTGGTPAPPTLQKVSVITINGRLSLTVATREEFVGLLDETRQILANL